MQSGQGFVFAEPELKVVSTTMTSWSFDNENTIRVHGEAGRLFANSRVNTIRDLLLRSRAQHPRLIRFFGSENLRGR